MLNGGSPGGWPVGCWGRCGAQAGDGAGGARGRVCSSLSLPPTAPLVCLAVLQPLCCPGKVSFPGLPAPAPQASGSLSVCLSVCLAASVLSLQQPRGSCLSQHLSNSLAPQMGFWAFLGGLAAAARARWELRRTPGRLRAHGAGRTRSPTPVPRTAGGPGRLASPVLRKPRGPTR